ncbi:MAG: hypothetical protein HYW78_00055 [Parcubacteria group bacterium]|nr:hypothetical protein [Parcubacteria group bacterium]
MKDNKIKKIVVVIAFALYAIALSSCALNKNILIRTSVANVDRKGTVIEDFESNQERIHAFLKKAEEIQDSVTHYNDLKKLGLDPEAENVNKYVGVAGLEYILGTKTPQLQITSPEQIDVYRKKFNRYIVVEYELFNTHEASDVLYISTKGTDRKGTDLEYVIVLQDSIVTQHGDNGMKNINEKRQEKEFLSGVFVTLEKTKGILELMLFYYLLENQWAK